MDEQQAKEASVKANRLEGAFNKLRECERILARVNKRAKARTYWDVTLTLDGSAPFGEREISFRVPLELVQQQCIDRVRDAQRAVIALGGTP